MNETDRLIGAGSVFYDKTRDVWCAQVYVREDGRRSRRKRSYGTEQEAHNALPDLRREFSVRPGALRKKTAPEPGRGSVWWDEDRQRWVGQLRYTEGGRRRAKTVVRLTEREARTALAELRDAREESRTAVPDRAATFARWLTYYAEEVLPEEGLAPDSVTAQRAYITRELLPSPLAPVRLKDLTPLAVMKYLNGLDGRGASTRKQIRVTLNKAIKSAVLHGRIEGTFVLALQGQTTKRAIRAARGRRRRPEYLRREDAPALLAAAEAEGWEPLVTTLLGTGLRRGEVLALRWRDIDFGAGTMSYEGAIAGDGEGGEVYGLTKTGETSVDFLAPQVLDALRRQHRAQAEARLAYRGRWGAGEEFDDFVFTNSAGRRYTADWVTKKVIALGDAAGVGHVTPKMLRHAAATYLAAEGVDSKVIAGVLHHASDRVTRDVYIHELEEARRRGVGALDRYLRDVTAAE